MLTITAGSAGRAAGLPDGEVLDAGILPERLSKETAGIEHERPRHPRGHIASRDVPVFRPRRRHHERGRCLSGTERAIGQVNALADIGRLPLTVDAVDLLLSKLQIVELNAKDVRDTLHLLSGVPVGGGAVASIDEARFGKVLGTDWGWWRTVTGNLAKLPALLAENPGLAPPAAPFDPIAASQQLLQTAESAPKGVKWRLRANVGDRMRWYELPEEVAH